MLCDECGKNEAKVHITKIVNGKKKTFNLCNECALEHQKKYMFGFNIEPSFSIHKFLAGLTEDLDLDQGVEYSPMGDRQCEKCGLTYKEFGKLGRLGCDRCYETFGKGLEPLLKRIHGNSMHTGKIPLNMGEHIRYKREIEQFKTELQTLVVNERFEEAAVLRDKIRDLETRLKD